MMCAALLMMTLGGCGENRFAEADRSLPERPAWMAPVAKSPITVGMDARVALARRDAELDTANARLERSGPWYEWVRSLFAGGGS